MSYQTSLKSLKSKVSVAEAGVEEETASRIEMQERANKEIMDFIFNFNRPDRGTGSGGGTERFESADATPSPQAVKSVKKGAKHAIKSGMKAQNGAGNTFTDKKAEIESPYKRYKISTSVKPIGLDQQFNQLIAQSLNATRGPSK